MSIALWCVALLAPLSAAHAAPWAHGPIQRIERKIEIPSVADAIPPPAARSQRASVTYVENLRDGGSSIRAFYRPRPDLGAGAVELLALERWSEGKLQSFRHRFVFGGAEHWTDWLPAALQSGLHTPWANAPQEGALAEPIEDIALVRSLHAELDAKALEYGLLDPPHARFDSGFPPVSWAPGEYVWQYDPGKWTLWSGYLWDFHNGWLFRGYRDPGQPGELLTPSQSLATSDFNGVRNYYLALSPATPDGYGPANSRALSPLDKFGIWASRAHGQNWWNASAWEAVNHFLNVDWGGYCNASTALPYLWKKPLHGVIDHDIVFDPRDLVGVLQVANYYVDYYFWGERHYQPGDYPDPSPQFVAELVHQYLGANQMPLIMNHEAGPAVGNVNIFSAKLTIENTADTLVRHGTFTFQDMGNMEDDLAKARKDDEAQVPDWTWGSDTKTYGFKILLNPGGTLQATQWDDVHHHPSFFWLPIGVHDDDQGWKNPYTKIGYVQELIDKSQ